MLPRLVTSEPYRFVHRPPYTGTFLIITGFGLALQSWDATFLIVVIAGVAFIIEEKVPVAEFGEIYTVYSTNTKKNYSFPLLKKDFINRNQNAPESIQAIDKKPVPVMLGLIKIR